MFPIDEETCAYLEPDRSPRSPRPRRGLRQGAGHVPRATGDPAPSFDETVLELDLSPRSCPAWRGRAARRTGWRAGRPAPTSSVSPSSRTASDRERLGPPATSRPSRCRTRARTSTISHGLGRHRGHHQLHQHLEPVRDGRRRSPGQEGRREGPLHSAVGQDQPRARQPGGHRLSRQRRPDASISTS